VGEVPWQQKRGGAGLNGRFGRAVRGSLPARLRVLKKTRAGVVVKVELRQTEILIFMLRQMQADADRPPFGRGGLGQKLRQRKTGNQENLGGFFENPKKGGR
jgi:hypothetical protein